MRGKSAHLKRGKKSFINIAYRLALIDGEYSAYEKNMLDVYYMEMGIDHSLIDENTDVDHYISDVEKNCSLEEKRIIIFELIGLAITDANFDESERAFIKNLSKRHGISKEFEKM